MTMACAECFNATECGDWGYCLKQGPPRPSPAIIDYDRLAKAVVAEQERKAAKEKRKELEPLAKLLDEGFTSARVDLWVVFDHISPEARQMIADAIRAYIKAET
jgi:hypothetical protein